MEDGRMESGSKGESHKEPDFTYITLSRAELREVIREAAHATVKETLEHYGFDVDNPAEQQRDNLYVRQSREGAHEVIRWSKRAAVGLVISGFLYAVWMGIAEMLIKIKGVG